MYKDAYVPQVLIKFDCKVKRLKALEVNVLGIIGVFRHLSTQTKLNHVSMCNIEQFAFARDT